MLKILHTSDWHIGRRLYGHSRYDEFSAFFAWLYACIVEQQIDVLIVAGDIFDTMTPSNKAQALYYEFLGKLIYSSCQHVIIVAGNHDSPSLLDAPKSLLQSLSVHIVGKACDNIRDEVIVLNSKTDNTPQAIILAVPYLRDKDVRHSISAESSEDKNSQLIRGIKAHYTEANEIAKQQQAAIAAEFNLDVPIIATGHLFATGGKTTDDDGVRDLYVGSLGQIGADTFADNIAYVALGHLHVPQLVGGREHIRYSGSPIAMGFGEAKQQKQVLVVSFDSEQSITNSVHKSSKAEAKVKTTHANSTKDIANNQTIDSNLDLFTELEETHQAVTTCDSHLADSVATGSEINKNNTTSDTSDKSATPVIEKIAVPCFHKLAQIKGDITKITTEINQLRALNIPVWVEVIYQAAEMITNLAEQLHALTADSQIDIIKIKNTQTYQRVLKQSKQAESLQELTHHEVFSRCLELNEIADSQKDELTSCFQQIVYELEHADTQAE